MRERVSCREVLLQLPVLLATAPADINPAVQAHLEECATCRAALGRYFPLEQQLAGISCPEPIPAGFTSAVMARLAADTPAPAARNIAPAARVRKHLFLHYLAAGAATLLLMLSGFFQMFTDMGAKGDWLNRQADALNTRVQHIEPRNAGGLSIWQKIWQSGMDVFTINNGSERHGKK